MTIAATSTEARAILAPLPEHALSRLPALTSDQMREVDRLAVDDFGIGLVQMMEHAGAGIAAVARQLLGALDAARVTVLAGPGNNGASGLVAARQLSNRGADVHVLISRPVLKLSDVARAHVATLLAMRVNVCVVPWDINDGELDAMLSHSDLLVDALLGYSAVGPPHGSVADLIKHAGQSGRPILSVDVPSGVDPNGEVAGSAIEAAATAIIALPKRGHLSASGRRQSGHLYLVDIGVPAALYDRSGVKFDDPFGAGPLVSLT